MTPGFTAYIRLLEKDFSDFCAQKLHPMGLSGGLLYFILYTGRHPGCTPGELSAKLHADSGYCTRCIAKLEQLCFLERKRSSEDKRVMQLQLTLQGENAFRMAQGLFKEWEDHVLAPLTEAERASLLSLLRRITPMPAFPGCPKN